MPNALISLPPKGRRLYRELIAKHKSIKAAAKAIGITRQKLYRSLAKGELPNAP